MVHLTNTKEESLGGSEPKRKMHYVGRQDLKRKTNQNFKSSLRSTIPESVQSNQGTKAR